MKQTLLLISHTFPYEKHPNVILSTLKIQFRGQDYLYLTSLTVAVPVEQRRRREYLSPHRTTSTLPISSFMRQQLFHLIRQISIDTSAASDTCLASPQVASRVNALLFRDSGLSLSCSHLFSFSSFVSPISLIAPPLPSKNVRGDHLVSSPSSSSSSSLSSSSSWTIN